MTFIKRKDLAKVALFMLNSGISSEEVEKELTLRYGVTKDSAEMVVRDAQAELFKNHHVMSTKCGVVI